MNRRGQCARLAETTHRWPWLTLLASLMGLLASALPAQHLLAFTAEGMQAGQWWRLWTGHFVHYGSAHLWGDLLAFVVWAALVEGESRRALALTLLLGAPLLLLVLDFTCAPLGEYRGLSGIDTALVTELIFFRGFLHEARTGEPGLGPWLTRLLGRPVLQLVGGFCCCLLVGKIGYELRVGHAILAHDLGFGVQLLPAAHAFGALLGLGLGLVCRRASRSRDSEPASSRELERDACPTSST